MGVGGWVGLGGSKPHTDFLVENRPKIPLNQYCNFGVVCQVYSFCTLLKSYQLLGFECSVHVSDGFPKRRSLDRGFAVSDTQF